MVISSYMCSANHLFSCLGNIFLWQLQLVKFSLLTHFTALLEDIFIGTSGQAFCCIVEELWSCFYFFLYKKSLKFKK